MRIVAATRNQDKLAMIAGLLPPGIDLELPGPGPADDEPDPGAGEPRRRLAEVAAGKAIAAAPSGSDHLVIASDGGLLVPCLSGWDPVRTRRFAGPGAADDDRVRLLIDMAAGLTGDQRRIGWCEAIAVARDGGALLVVTAESAPGWLADQLPGAVDSEQDGFWVHRIWRDAPAGPAHPGAWSRLALLVRPFIAGLAAS